MALCNLSGEKEGGLLSDGQCHCLAPSGAAARHEANLWVVNDHPHLLNILVSSGYLQGGKFDQLLRQRRSLLI